jgi:hypothetical protein
MATTDTFSIMVDMKTQDKLAWNKLEKSVKLKKLGAFADAYSKDLELSPGQVGKLKEMLKERLNRKQLQKSTDVAYDKEKGEVTCIESLVVHQDGTFGFRSVNSVSPLASLAPKTRKSRVDVGLGGNHTARCVAPNGARAAAILTTTEGGDADPADVDDILVVGVV